MILYFRAYAEGKMARGADNYLGPEGHGTVHEKYQRLCYVYLQWRTDGQNMRGISACILIQRQRMRRARRNESSLG